MEDLRFKTTVLRISITSSTEGGSVVCLWDRPIVLQVIVISCTDSPLSIHPTDTEESFILLLFFLLLLVFLFFLLLFFLLLSRYGKRPQETVFHGSDLNWLSFFCQMVVDKCLQ